jgi:hypothetical protein
MGPGNFQLTPKVHPITGRNSQYALLWDVLTESSTTTDQDGKLDLNTRPVHCTEDGRLDYRGDGTLAKGPDPSE